jgi:hypothetical protein
MNRFTRYIQDPAGAHALVYKKPFEDFEIATLMLSAIAYRNMIGPITLCCDERGEQFAETSGIGRLYNEVRRLWIDPRINQDTYWAAGKIAAINLMKAPCILVDLDAVLWRRPSTWNDVNVLHDEPRYWEAYAWNSLWSEAEDIIKTTELPCVSPLNTAILGFNDQEILSEYRYLADTLMVRGSVKGVTAAHKVLIKGSGRDVPVTEMVFAEQYSLPMLCGVMGKRVGKITTLDIASDHPVKSKMAYHLWNSKRFYAQHGRAREVYLSWVMDKIWNIVEGTNDESIVRAIANKLNLPTIRVIDGNTDAVRWSRQGEWFGPGEIVTRL